MIDLFKTLRVSLLLVLAAVSTCRADAEDWPRFRGVNGAGVSTSQRLPVEFTPKKNVLWKVKAPRGSSSPILSGGLLFYSSYDGNRRTLHCLDAATGKSQWEQSVTKVRDENATPPNGPATPTPVADGKNVFVLYPDVGVLCYSQTGAERWRVDLHAFHSMHGIASSLMTVDALVIVVADQLAGSYMTALSEETGQVAWKVERVDGLTGGYSTPTIYQPPHGAPQLVVSGPLEFVGYDPRSGKRLWWVSGVTNSPISLPVLWQNRAFVCEAVGEPVPFSALSSFDKNKDGKVSSEEVKSNLPMSRLVERIDKSWGEHKGIIGPNEWEKAFGSRVNKGGLVAIDLGGSGDVTQTHVRWTYGKGVPTIPSALVYDDLIYTVRDGGILSAFEAATGKLVRQARLTPGGRQYDASPIAADGLIYLLDVKGGVSVVKAGRDWKQLATNELDEACWASPAICDGRLYIRTAKSLYCFGK